MLNEINRKRFQETQYLVVKIYYFHTLKWYSSYVKHWFDEQRHNLVLLPIKKYNLISYYSNTQTLFCFIP